MIHGSDKRYEGGDAIETEEPMNRIPSNINSINRSVSILEDLVDTVCMKLDPIMSPSLSGNRSDDAPRMARPEESQKSAVSYQLESIDDRINYIIGVLREVIENSEI